MTTHDALAAQLLPCLTGSARLMSMLAAVRELGPRDAYVAGGAIRTSYWAHRHGTDPRHVAGDVDVVFFDGAAAHECDRALEQELTRRAPHLVWEVSNQAHVHLWYEGYTGVRIMPLASTVEGIALWPETATCIGVRLAAGDASSALRRTALPTSSPCAGARTRTAPIPVPSLAAAWRSASLRSGPWSRS